MKKNGGGEKNQERQEGKDLRWEKNEIGRDQFESIAGMQSGD